MDGEPTKDNILEKEFKINNGHIFIGKTLEKEVYYIMINISCYYFILIYPEIVRVFF